MTTSMPSSANARHVRFGAHDLELGGPQLGELRDSNALLDDVVALRARYAEDGYLLVRGLHDREQVLTARRQMLEQVAAAGRLDPARPLMDAGIGTGDGVVGDLTVAPAFRELVRSPRLMRFFGDFLGGPALTYDFQWMRLIPTGVATGAHYDIVYMGRGTDQVMTCWTPLGSVSYDQGPLAICVGSHRDPRFSRLRDTYGRMDVDRDRVAGWFSDDPLEIVDRFGGRWATTEFQPGDALIFGMYTLHASLMNVSDRFRLSSDTRYQLASEPADERWVGAQPKGHYGLHAGPQTPMAEKRAEWGV